jgi:hypothetical protein
MSAHLSRLRLFQRHLRAWFGFWVWDWVRDLVPGVDNRGLEHDVCQGGHVAGAGHVPGLRRGELEGQRGRD